MTMVAGAGLPRRRRIMNDVPTTLRSLARQEQFLEGDRPRRGDPPISPPSRPPPARLRKVPLSRALGRVLACPVIAEVDVPGFDRANVDGFAVRADDTAGASERMPRQLTLLPEILTPGKEPLRRSPPARPC